MSVSIIRPSSKKILLSTLLGCTALYLPAAANAERLSAKTSWAVSRVASAAQGSYCTMAQKYVDDTILTLARNINNEYSLALDYKESRFSPSKPQSVKLSAGGVSSKVYQVSPQSERTLVVGIGADTNIVDKAGSQGQINIQLGDVTSEFELSNFVVGQKEMDACLAALRGSSAKPAALKPSSESVAPPKAVVQHDVREPSVEGLLAAAPVPSVAVEAVDVVSMGSDLPIPTGQVSAENVDISVLREENAQLTRALAEQRKAFENRQAQVDDSALAELQEKIVSYEQENMMLRSQLQSKAADDSLKSKSDTLQSEMNVLKAENKSLKDQVEAYATLQADAAGNDSEAEKLKGDLKTLVSQMDVLKAENDALNAQMSSLQKDAESKQLKLAGGNWDLEQATRRYQESQREIVRLGAILQTKESQCSTEKKDLEYMLFDPAIASKAQIAKLNSLEESVKEKGQLLELAEQRLAETQKTITTEKDSEIAELKKSVLKAKLEYADKLKAASTSQDSAIEQLKLEIAEKDRLIVQSEEKSKQAEFAKFSLENKEKAIAELRADLAAKDQSLLSVKMELAEAQKKAEEAKLAASKIEKVEGSLSESNKTIVNLNADLAHKTADIDKLKEKLALAESLKTSLQSKEQNVASLQSDLANKVEELKSVKSKLAQAESAQQELTKVQAKLADKTSELETIRLQLAQAEKDKFENAKFQADIADKDVALKTVQQKLTDAQKYKSQADMLQAKVVELQAQLSAEQAKSQQLAQKMQSEQAAQQAASMAAMQSQVQLANQQINQLKKEIADAKAVTSYQVAELAPAAAPQMPVKSEPVASSRFMSADEFGGLLRSAGVPVKGNVQPVQGGDSSYRAYSWKTDSLYGSAEMRQVGYEGQFDTAVTQYLDRARSRCKGEFAAVPSSVRAANVAKSKSYEIACVSGTSSSSASVLFTYGDNVVTTVAHEGRAEAMDLAIDARDRVSSQIN